MQTGERTSRVITCFLILLIVLPILAILHFSTAYCDAKQREKIVRAALEAGREDIARERLPPKNKSLSERSVALFFSKDLRRKLS